ncbi:MAG: arylesterase, partial [Betaproteobacteria bacterium]|nr:arylesterase [Betaproteobacteria bacterium]
MACMKSPRDQERGRWIRNCGSWLGTIAFAMAFLLAAARSVAVSERTPSGAKLLVLGDSWSAEYGLKRGQGWVALLEARLKQSAAYQDIQIVNASVSGETTAGGLSRLPALLERHHPQFVLIALGGNDALRGLPLETTRSQLLAMIKQAKARGASVLLIGMRMPPNYGSYGQSFERVFPRLAKEQGLPLVPFLMQGKEFDLSAFQADRIHPNEGAQPH